ncbi:MAG TPA: DUF2169 domain-containing protein [Planctomycetota bacterium]|jgi:hypothetical protein|nr:DUF2169 domain-containing protein [Planctomycetota bacterium]
MWTIENETPYAAERSLTTDLEGRDVWLVVVKATFLIQPDGSTSVAAEQVPVRHELKHRGEPASTSLLYESDMVLTKANTDVLLEGHAYVPGGREATQADVMMQVGKIKKIARVWGDRAWTPGLLGLKLTDPLPFRKMPLTWERAFGGTDLISDNKSLHDWEPRNPVGAGFGVQSEHVVGRKAPNVEDPGHLISSWKDRPRPLGFGPIARHWIPRRKFAGTYDEKWEKERQPLLPRDFDPRFNQTAPEDQQAEGYLKGGIPVELYNLTPSGVLKFALPKVALRFSTLVGSESTEHRADLMTVLLEPDFPRVVLVWRTSLPVHGKKLKIDRTVVGEKEYVELGS